MEVFSPAVKHAEWVILGALLPRAFARGGSVEEHVRSMLTTCSSGLKHWKSLFIASMAQWCERVGLW